MATAERRTKATPAGKQPEADRVMHGGQDSNTPTAVELHALAIAAKEAGKRRGELKVGRGQQVDVTVRIAGAIDVGEGSTSMMAKLPPLVDVIALTLAHLPNAAGARNTAGQSRQPTRSGPRPWSNPKFAPRPRPCRARSRSRRRKIPRAGSPARCSCSSSLDPSRGTRQNAPNASRRKRRRREFNLFFGHRTG